MLPNSAKAKYASKSSAHQRSSSSCSGFIQGLTRRKKDTRRTLLPGFRVGLDKELEVHDEPDDLTMVWCVKAAWLGAEFGAAMGAYDF
jgi:hypothetical protein